MKKYDLLPTYENLVHTYLDDTIKRNNDLFDFITLLNAVDTGYSIALDGSWGSGKTFFVKQAKLILDAHNSFVVHEREEDTGRIQQKFSTLNQKKQIDIQPQVCVYYDAWENDNDSEPILSLVYAILQSVGADFSFKERSWLNIGADIMKAFTGRDWGKVINDIKGDNPLSDIIRQKNTEKLVAEFLDSLIPEKGNRLIVFVDELDRCKPSFAVRLLERIKHYLSNERITFVFSVNINELQHTVRKHYGNDFNGTRYLDRFFDLRLSLPKPNMQAFYYSLDFNDRHHTYDIVCAAVIEKYHFELREIAKYIRLTKVAAYHPTHNDNSNFSFNFAEGRGTQYALLHILPIMIGLKIYDENLFTEFINGDNSAPLFEVLSTIQLMNYNELLEQHETYGEPLAGEKKVSLKEKLDQLYDAIFVKKYDNGIYSTTIAKMEFRAPLKNTLLRAAGAFSKYTDYNIE